ncbi:unnamed protein product [Schistosoma margrebowiei]|uniref:Uncharacterized protein n=1 Tax=Schistosoma margrebowiei TaxID=48269 RepID=A0A183N2Y1_9TREM|nr:unnamed protein product [Schistosoma margrebowiei]
MKTSTSEGKHGIQWTSRMQLDDLDFADDLALLSQTQQQMPEKTNSVLQSLVICFPVVDKHFTQFYWDILDNRYKLKKSKSNHFPAVKMNITKSGRY